MGELVPDSGPWWDFEGCCTGHDVCFGTCGTTRKACDDESARIRALQVVESWLRSRKMSNSSNVRDSPRSRSTSIACTTKHSLKVAYGRRSALPRSWVCRRLYMARLGRLLTGIYFFEQEAKPGIRLLVIPQVQCSYVNTVDLPDARAEAPLPEPPRSFLGVQSQPCIV